MPITVNEAGVTKTGLGQRQDMQEITIRTTEGVECTWFCKQGTPVPTPGEVLPGNVEDSQYGKKYKAPRTGNSGGNSGGGFKNDPEREKKIVRQHSQEMAIRYVAAADIMLNGIGNLAPIIDWFEKDAFGVSGEPTQAPPTTLDDVVTTTLPQDSIPF